MIVMTANVGRGVPPAEYRANIERIKRRFRSPIIGWQEVDEADQPEEFKIMREVFGDRFAYAGKKTSIPISFPKDTVQRVGTARITPGCKGLGGYTPNRPIVQQRLRPRHRPNLPPLVDINNHFPINRAATRSRRADCREALDEVIAYWWERECSMIIKGDFNGRLSRLHRGEVRVVEEPLDHMRLIVHPKGVQVEVQDTGKIDLTIDKHDAHWARLGLSAPPKAA